MKSTNDYKDAEDPQTSTPRRCPEVDLYINHFLNAVCDTSRRYILEMFMPPNENPDALIERRSGDIARALQLAPATTSEHLSHLTKVGLLISRREGNAVYYRLRNHQLARAFHMLLLALDEEYASAQPDHT